MQRRDKLLISGWQNQEIVIGEEFEKEPYSITITDFSNQSWNFNVFIKTPGKEKIRLRFHQKISQISDLILSFFSNICFFLKFDKT